jgi:type IV secretory pathway TrbL component
MTKAAKKKSAVAMIVFSQSRDIPFNRIFLSDSNVREINVEDDLDELTHDIDRREDIVQGLNVRAIRDADGNETGDFETPAGGRRYRAIARLVEAGRFPSDGPVPCLVKKANAKTSAVDDSLAENTVRLAILAIQLFVTLIEFKLTTLAGFVLIPFGLFGKTAFMAERVLGNVVSSGIKVLVLAVIIGIGSTLFSQFTQGFGGQTPSIDEAMAVVLAALSLLGLGIFGPGIASGLVSGGPQLGAGAAVGTGLAAGGMTLAGAGAAGLAAKGGAAAFSTGAAAIRGGATAAGAAFSAYSLASLGQSGAAGSASGLGGVAHAAGHAATSPLRRAAASVKSSFSEGVKAGFNATGGSSTMGSVGGASETAPSSTIHAPSTPPGWAQRVRQSGHIGHAIQTTAHAVRSGDSHASASSVNLQTSDRS